MKTEEWLKVTIGKHIDLLELMSRERCLRHSIGDERCELELERRELEEDIFHLSCLQEMWSKKSGVPEAFKRAFQ